MQQFYFCSNTDRNSSFRKKTETGSLLLLRTILDDRLKKEDIANEIKILDRMLAIISSMSLPVCATDSPYGVTDDSHPGEKSESAVFYPS